MKKITRFTACLLILTMVIILCGCGTSNPESSSSSAPAASNNSSSPAPSNAASPSGGDTTPNSPSLTSAPDMDKPDVKFADAVSFSLDDQTIPVVNPLNVAGSSIAIQWAYRLVYDTLVHISEDFQYSAKLATSWETDDWKTITFKLRDDVYFHNGDKFTAEDVVNTYNMAIANPGTISNDRWNRVESVTAIDQYTVQMVLDQVNVDFLYDMAHPGASILNKASIDADPEKGVWNGTGAYMVSEVAPNDYTVFIRNDNYWKELPITRQITLMTVPEVSARMMMLENDEIDGVIGGLSVFDTDRIVENTEDYTCYEYYPPGPAIIGFNLEDPIIGDWNFRMAVGSVIDREEMAYVSRGNYAIPETHGSWWGMVTQYYNENIQIVPFDLDAAKTYLDASVYNGEEIEIIACFPDNIARAEYLQNQLAKIGVTAIVTPLDPPALASRVAYGNNQAQIISFLATWTPSATSARNILLPGMYHNRWSYNNPIVNQMLEEASMIIDEKEREAHYMRIQEIVAEDPPGFNTHQMRNIFACHKGVGGVLKFGDIFDLSYVYREIG